MKSEIRLPRKWLTTFLLYMEHSPSVYNFEYFVLKLILICGTSKPIIKLKTALETCQPCLNKMTASESFKSTVIARETSQTDKCSKKLLETHFCDTLRHFKIKWRQINFSRKKDVYQRAREYVTSCHCLIHVSIPTTLNDLTRLLIEKLW